VIVLDASAAFEFLLQTRKGELISEQLSRVTEVHAPHLLDIELASTLRRCFTLGTLTAERAREVLDDLRVMRVQRYWHVPLLARIWDFRNDFSAYDACYLALAEALDATLLTCDKAMSSVRLRHGQIELL
jgi:predicted nucleic acid-binding protein